MAAPVKTEGACVLWTGRVNAGGYGQVTVRKFGKRTTSLAHRVAYCHHHALTLEDIHGAVVLHGCDTPACVNPYHLTLGTQRDNVQDRIAKRRPAGSRAAAKLDAAKAAAIRARWSGPMPGVKGNPNSQTALARDFGVSVPTIQKILKGEHYAVV